MRRRPEETPRYARRVHDMSTRVCVILDSNIWRSEVGLRTERGAKLLHYIQRLEGLLGLPEQVETEATRLLVELAANHTARIDDELRQLQVVTGRRPHIDLPNQDSLEAAVHDRFHELETVLLRVPIGGDHYARVHRRITEKRSPNRKGVQYQDSLIWEAVMDVAGGHETMFVTNDSAFYDAGSPDEMASDLRDECQRKDVQIALHRGLATVLAQLEDRARPLETQQIAEQLALWHREYVDGVTTPHGGHPGELTSHSITPFASEVLGAVHLDYSLVGAMLSDSGECLGSYELEGEGTWDLPSQRVVNASVRRCRVISGSGDDEQTAQSIVLGVASVFLGTPPPSKLEIRGRVSG
jgi:hypothetical protein